MWDGGANGSVVVGVVGISAFLSGPGERIPAACLSGW